VPYPPIFGGQEHSRLLPDSLDPCWACSHASKYHTNNREEAKQASRPLARQRCGKFWRPRSHKQGGTKARPARWRNDFGHQEIKYDTCMLC